VHSQPPSPLAEWLVRTIGRLIARCLYKTNVFGSEKLPEGGFLLLPNHLTWVDAVLLQISCPRPIRFVIWEDFYHMRVLQPLLYLIGALPISDRRAKDAVKAAVELIKKGEIVCIFPEGELSKSGSLLRLKRGYEIIARQAKCPVVTAWMDQLWGSVFSFSGGKYFWKWPRHYPYKVTVAFGAPIEGRDADIGRVRQEFMELAEFCFQQRSYLKGHLGEACLRGLKKLGGETAVLDGMDSSSLSGSNLLAAGLALAQWLKTNVSEKRVAIVLPSSKGAMVANLGCLLADKIPVNLNFTAGHSALEASIKKAGATHCLTASVMAEKLKDFPWPKHVVHLGDLVPKLKLSIIKWRLISALLPAGPLARFAGLPREGDRKEAVLLFTSGSSGEPKGVALTHRNLLANTAQFGEMLDMNGKDVILGALPFFHSFGSTVCLLFPMTEGIKVVTYPNPLETSKCAKLIERYKTTLVLATPTFLRGYLKRAEPEQLRSVRLIVTGAEKLPDELAAAFKARFGIDIMQGYGLTETSPAASFNIPNLPDCAQPSNRSGSCGKLVPGLAAQIRHPETDALISIHETGMLWFKGANVFDGYLDDVERTAEVIKDGWFRTGDLGRFDEDGFLFIEGRVSRFSKIAGEMVPHETVESKIVELFELSSEGERVVMITSVPDDAKGEALVMLTTRDFTPAQVREKLNEAGLPNLWIPKRIQRVEKIPILASGKLDLQACRVLAEGNE